MNRKNEIFIGCLLICFMGTEAEIVNIRKHKATQSLTSNVEVVSKSIPVLESLRQENNFIPKPNSPNLEKIIIPLLSPSDPARPQTKQPSQFTRPFTQKLITTVNFDLNPENPHKGVVYSPIDIGSVLSSMEGRVVAVDYMDGYYNYVIIEHPNGFFTVYGNLEGVYVAEGQKIKKGEVLGNLLKEKGLYFQVTHGKKILDPHSLIKS